MILLRSTAFATALFATLLGSVDAASASAERPVVLAGVTLIDGTGAAPRTDVSIVIRGAKIVDVVDGELEVLPDGAQVVDASGGWAVPGLCDVHTHLATDPSRPGYAEIVRGQLRELLGRGITDVRDMGGDGRALRELSRSASLGELPAPDIHFAALVGGPALFRDARILSASDGVEPGSAPWARELTESTDLAAAMLEIAEFGASGIKVYADMDPPLLAEVAVAAREAGLKVWSHWIIASRRTGAMDAVTNGVDVVSHAYMLMHDVSPEARGSAERVLESAGGATLFEAMRERGTILDATLIAAERLRPPPDYVHPGDFGARVAQLAREHGVRVATGSDAPGDGVLPAIHLEYALLVRKAGFTPLEVIESATRISCAAIGIEESRGTIEPGRDATLLLYDADPAVSVAPLTEPVYVIKRGVVYSGPNLRDASTAVEPLGAWPAETGFSRDDTEPDRSR